MDSPSINRYKNHRSPAEIISHAVWLYFRFCVSYRAVDQDGTVLDILVQSRRNKQAAKKFFRKLLTACQCVPRVILTDQLKSYGAAKREMLPGVEHRHKARQNYLAHRQFW
jgi:transposase-like protein